MWLGFKPPVGALLSGRTTQDLCFSSPVLHARHVACNLPTLLLKIVLGISGDPLACCLCWDPSRAAELFLRALPHDPHPLLHRDLHEPLVPAWKVVQPSALSLVPNILMVFFTQLC